MEEEHEATIDIGAKKKVSPPPPTDNEQESTAGGKEPGETINNVSQHGQYVHVHVHVCVQLLRHAV